MDAMAIDARGTNSGMHGSRGLGAHLSQNVPQLHQPHPAPTHPPQHQHQHQHQRNVPSNGIQQVDSREQSLFSGLPLPSVNPSLLASLGLGAAPRAGSYAGFGGLSASMQAGLEDEGMVLPQTDSTTVDFSTLSHANNAPQNQPRAQGLGSLGLAGKSSFTATAMSGLGDAQTITQSLQKLLEVPSGTATINGDVVQLFRSGGRSGAGRGSLGGPFEGKQASKEHSGGDRDSEGFEDLPPRKRKHLFQEDNPRPSSRPAVADMGANRGSAAGLDLRGSGYPSASMMERAQQLVAEGIDNGEVMLPTTSSSTNPVLLPGRSVESTGRIQGVQETVVCL